MTFNKIFLLNYFTHSYKANCIDDLDKILAKYPIDANKDINLMFHDETPFYYQKCIPLEIDCIDNRNFNIPK